VIAGLVSPDGGRINKAKHITIGYLPEEGGAVDLAGELS
jgi:ABC-type uncharacterized transport system ATPase subunit